MVVTDESVVVLSPDALRRHLIERSRWIMWWPGSDAVLVRDDDAGGLEWLLSGVLVGRSRVTVVQQVTGTLVRYVLEADPVEPGSRTRPRHLPDSPHGERELRRIEQVHRMAWKRSVWSLVDHGDSSPTQALTTTASRRER